MSAVVLSAAATERFFIPDFAITPGETRTVSIMLDNEEEYTAFQCDLYLPEGLIIDDDSFVLTSRKNANHTLTVTEFPGRSYRLMSYSLKLKTYSGNSGPLVNFTLTASNEFGLPQNILIRNCVFTTPEGQEIAFAEESCTISLKGDVNWDGLVDIDDVTDLINFVLTGSGSSLNMVAADVFGDTFVNINDVTELIHYVLTGTW